METAGRFNSIADIYDETREPLTEEAIDMSAKILSDDGCRQILEVGIGTGRIAGPLSRRNFEIVGVDLSRGMLAKAQEKGIGGLVMGDADNLPFQDKVFDAVVMAHVLHLLENPTETFGKLTRVARKEVAVFVRKRDESTGLGPAEQRLGLRDAFRRAAEEIGYELPARFTDWRARFRNEMEFLATFPPSELIVIQDVPIVTTVGERLSFFEKRAYGVPSNIPDEVFQKMMERVRASVDTGKEVSYRWVEQLAIWRLPS